MDTVPAAVNAHMVETEEVFKTDGTTALGADDKAAIAVLLDIAGHADDGFAILCLPAEEIGLYGSACLSRKFFSPLDIIGCYTLDATNKVGGIITGAVGKSRLTIEMIGKSAHAGFSPESGISAIKMASELCTSIQDGRINQTTTVNIGSFIANGSINVVPDKATICLEVRSASDDTRTSILSSIKDKAHKIASSYKGKVKIVEENLYSPYKIDTHSPLFIRAKEAIESSGRDCYTFDTTGGSDANNLNALGIETILLATGYFGAHSVDEYIEKSEMKALKDLVSNLTKN